MLKQRVIALLFCLLLVWLTEVVAYTDGCAKCGNVSDRLCGPNCLLVVCKKLGVSATIEELSALSGVDAQGSTLAGLQKAAEAKGLEAAPMKIGISELATLKIPAIAHLWQSHFVVVEPDGAGGFRVTDPPAEPKVLNAVDFGNIYSGFALLVAKNENQFPISDPKGADLRVDSYAWDFGVVEEGAKLDHIFLCSNLGNEDLAISTVDSSCSCTTVSSGQQKIPPGGKFEIKVGFDTTGREGAQDQTVYVRSNDPVIPVAQLPVVGLVWPSRLVYSPRNISFGKIAQGHPATSDISVSDSEARRVQIEKLSSDIAFIQASATRNAQNTGYKIILSLAEDAPPGNFGGNLTIRTNHPKDPIVIVPITGIVRGDIDVLPDTFFFGILNKGTGAERTIRVSTITDKPFKIKSVRSSTKSVKTRVVSNVSGKSYEVIGTLRRKTPVGYIKSEIIIHTDDAQQREIRIPVYALVEE